MKRKYWKREGEGRGIESSGIRKIIRKKQDDEIERIMKRRNIREEGK